MSTSLSHTQVRHVKTRQSKPAGVFPQFYPNMCLAHTHHVYKLILSQAYICKYPYISFVVVELLQFANDAPEGV